MDTTGPKTPAPLPFAAWQAMAPATAAREVHARVAALPGVLRSAALAWLRPERKLALDLEAFDGGPASLRAANGRKITPSIHGIPYFLKDLFDAAGVPTRAGSTFLEKVRPTPGDCTIVRRLRECGAAFAGKTHLVEFASGLTGENPHYGDCPHPRFPSRLSGGSSSGSAALVAAGVVPFAIGTDTGGSIRVPAAWCGLYGFRLTPGNELIRDAFPLAPTMDTAGWFTAHPSDMLAAWRAIVGETNQTADRPPRGCYLPATTLLPSVNPALDAAGEAVAARFAERADPVTQASLLSSWRNALETYVTIGMSEAHAVHRDWLAPYREHYDPVIWQRFTDAGHFLPEKITAARADLEQIRRTWTHFFATYDFLVLPSVPTAAPIKAECTPQLRRAILTLTAPASLGGFPCLSVPVALPGGLSAGLQIVLAGEKGPAIPWILNQRVEI